jgi:head-tail adaptor
MDIGKLNKRCRVEYPVVTKDPVYGSPVTVWETLDTRWANLQDAMPSRDEQIRNGASMTKVRSRLRMRYTADIDTTMRVVIFRPTEQIWNIIGGPAEIGARDGVEFMIERVS